MKGFCLLFAAQRVYRAHLCRLSCGIDAEEEADAAGEQQRDGDDADIDIWLDIYYRAGKIRAGYADYKPYYAADEAQYSGLG